MVNCAQHNSASLLHNSITCGICQCDDNKEPPASQILSQNIVNAEDTENIVQGLGKSSDKSLLNNNESDTEPNSDDERELTEDQVAINKRQDTTGDDLPSVVQIDNLEKEIYQCAPGENNTPKYMLLDDNFEVLTFPDLFPYGKGGYMSAERPIKLGIRKYFQQRLLNCDGRFAKNMEYMFCAQYISDIKSDANMAIWLSRGCTLNGSLITAGTFCNPDAIKQLVRNQEAYKFLKNVRGSPSYWQSELYDVLAMLCIIGIPTFFLTLLAADLHWPEMIQAVAAQHGRKMSHEDVFQMSLCERSDYLWNNPVTGVCMFQHRVENFFSQYLLSSSKLGGFSHKCSSDTPSETCTFGLLSKKTFLLVWIPKTTIIKNYYCLTPS